MADLRDLYQEVILDHTKHPRNFRVLEGATHRAEGFNPLCGDRITLYLKVEGGVVKDAAFQGGGCAISTSSASMMTDSIKGKTLEQVQGLFERFHELVAGQPSAEPGASGLGKLEAFMGVREFPVRVKCATLTWHTLRAALEKKAEPVSTE